MCHSQLIVIHLRAAHVECRRLLRVTPSQCEVRGDRLGDGLWPGEKCMCRGWAAFAPLPGADAGARSRCSRPSLALFGSRVLDHGAGEIDLSLSRRSCVLWRIEAPSLSSEGGRGNEWHGRRVAESDCR